VDERIESFREEHLDECASLLVATFNAKPWNDEWTLDTAKQEITWTTNVPGFVGLVSRTKEWWLSPPDTGSRMTGGTFST
jgi:hypothetical protein